MKKLLILMTISLLLFSGLIAKDDSMQNIETRKGIKKDYQPSGESRMTDVTWTVPNFSISVPPTDIMTSFYDYSPGSYDGKPVRIHTNEEGELLYTYFVFHATATTTAERYIYYSYLDSDGNLTYDRVSGNSFKEGYPGCAIDPETGDPFVTYHHDDYEDQMYDCAITYDLNHFIGGAGYWADPVNVIDNHNNPIAPHADDEFNWPYPFVSSSPQGDEYRRVYYFASNWANHYDNQNDSNIIYAYADFTTTDLESLTPLDWTVHLQPQIDTYVNTDENRTYTVVDVDKNGNIYIFGYLHPGDDVPDEDPESFILYNNDHGHIDAWQEFTYNAELYVDPPLDQDGSNTLLEDPYFANWFSSHLGAVIDNDGKFHWLSTYALNGISLDDGSSVFIKHCNYMKKLTWDPATNDLTYADLYPKGIAPYDDSPYLPWDENEDGIVDVFTDDGGAVTQKGWPIFYHDATANAWSDANFKMAYNEETGWMAAVWQDGLKNAYFEEYDVDEFSNWRGVPEIFICMSYDGGETWTDPITINSIDTPEFQGIIPEYVYPADKLIKIDDDTQRLYIYFYNDNDFGSSVQYPELPTTGGALSYFALDIEYTEEIVPNVVSTVPNNPIKEFSVRNYPNPFNPTTKLSFDLPKAGSGSVQIYNIKGQIVKTLKSGEFTQGSHSLTWNGEDESNNNVGSGIYFYKVSIGEYQATNKMVLMK